MVARARRSMASGASRCPPVPPAGSQSTDAGEHGRAAGCLAGCGGGRGLCDNRKLCFSCYLRSTAADSANSQARPQGQAVTASLRREGRFSHLIRLPVSRLASPVRQSRPFLYEGTPAEHPRRSRASLISPSFAWSTRIGDHWRDFDEKAFGGGGEGPGALTAALGTWLNTRANVSQSERRVPSGTSMTSLRPN